MKKQQKEPIIYSAYIKQFTEKVLLKNPSALLGFLFTNMQMIMMDTISLSIRKGQYAVLNPSDFIPSFKRINEDDESQLIEFLKVKKGLQNYRLNPNVEFKQSSLVYPNITIYETYKRTRDYQCNLKPHVSLPRMLLGYNVEEIDDSYYQEAVTTFQSRLKDMGVIVRDDAMHEAEVTTLHYCMNILMGSESEARLLLNAVNKMTLGERYENHSRDYSNKGKTIRFHTKVFELIIYLKYYDLLTTGHDRIDKKRTLREKALAEELFRTNKIPPLIRIEIRFNGKPAIRQHLRTILGVDKKVWTFREVFSQEISRKVIQFYWHKLTDNPLNRLMLTEISDEDLYLKLREKFNTAPQRILDNSLGLFKRLQAQGTVNFKEEILRNYSRSKWYKDQERIIKFLEENRLLTGAGLFDFMEIAITKKPVQLGLPI